MLPENAIASLSNVLVNLSSDTTPTQFRLFYSALGLFNNSNQETLNKIREDAQSELIKLKELHIEKGLDPETFRVDETKVLKTAVQNYYFRFADKRTFKFDFKELVEFWSDVKSYNSQYTVIKNALDDILKVVYIAEFKDEDGAKIVKRINVFSEDSTRSLKGVESVELVLNTDFIPYLVMLNEIYVGIGYTTIPIYLLQNKRRESSFSILNFLLRHYKKNAAKKTQAFKFKIEEFRRATDTENKYQQFKDLRVRYIEPAVEEIDDDPNMSLKVSFQKTGRTFTHISFVFTIHKMEEDIVDISLKDPDETDDIGYIEGEFEKL